MNLKPTVIKIILSILFALYSWKVFSNLFSIAGPAPQTLLRQLNRTMPGIIAFIITFAIVYLIYSLIQKKKVKQ